MKAGWDTGTLVSVSTAFTDGDWIETKDQSERGIRLVQTGNVGVGEFKDRRDKARFIDEDTFTRLKCFEVLPNDCLISRLPDPVGRGCLIPDTGDKMITAVDCSVVRVDESQILPSFYLFYLQSDEYFALVEADCTGTTRKRISRKKLEAIPIPIPPLEEQKRIVAVLDAAFEGLTRAKENAETNLQNARELFERRMAKAFDEVTNASDAVARTVAEIAYPQKGSIRTGPFGSQLLHSEFTDHGIAVLGIDNAVKNEFQWGKSRFISPKKYEVLQRYTVKAGDVIITIMGTCGRCAVVPDDIPTAINTKHLCCITLDPERCLPNYLHAYFLHSEASLTYLNANASGSVMDGLNMGLIKELPVYLPDLEEQQAIAELFTESNAKTSYIEANYRTKLTDIADLRQSLLQKAFAGELT